MKQWGVGRMRSDFGGYRIVSILAEGGMGVVYRAEDRQTGQIVALKTILGSRLLNLECLRREIHALSRLHHPGIVRILQQGVDGGIPWYAMELLEGTSLRSLLDGGAAQATRSTNSPRPPIRGRPIRGAELDFLLRVIRRLCAPLAFLHGEGIVHRDMKPENVVVRPSGEPVIVDFGLAAQFGGPVSRDAISAELHAYLGTFGYMAPEQRRGELLDARVDIYALGCILYEALTGQLPLSSPPPPISQLTDGVDPALEALVMRLLAVDPRERVGYLDDLASALTAIVPPEPYRGPVPRTYLYRPSFVGRHEALSRLSSWLEREPGGIALVQGESGAGKTRLVMEAARIAVRRSMRVVTAECVPIEGTADAAMHDAPLHPLRPVLRAIADYCRIEGSAVTERILGRRGRVLAAYEPALATLPSVEAQPEPAALPPQAARARLYADVAETLTLFASEAALLIIIDDLQWMDELTSSFLVGHADRLAQTGVRIIGTYRSEAVNTALVQIAAVAHLSIRIGRLGGPDVAAIMADMLAIAEPPEALVRFMLDRSEGNPFFVAEYLRAAVHEGWLIRDARGKWGVVGIAGGSLPLPDSLRELVTRRLSDVSDTAARFIEIAAVMGRDVEPALIVEILELTDTVQLGVLQELMRKQVLEELSDNRFRFAHDKLREVAYDRLADPDRRRLHTLAAGALERTRADDAPSFGVLAHHFLQAGINDRALDYLEKAGHYALRTAAHGQARQFFARALELAGDRTEVEPFRRARWMRRMAEAAFGQGDIDGSEAQAVAALARLTEPLPSTRAGWMKLVLSAALRQWLAWLLPLGRAARSDDERSRSLEAAVTAGQLASIYYFTGDALRMVGLLLVGVNLANRAGSPTTVVEAHARLGYIAGVAGLHRTARRYFARASALSFDSADAAGRAVTMYLHAFYHLGLAEWRAAEDKGSSAVALLLDNGDRQDAEIAQTIASHAVYFSGRFGEARSRYQQVLESARARGNVQHEAWGLYLLGRSDLALGEVELATTELEHAWRLLDTVADRFSTVMCGGLLAQAYLAKRDLEAAAQLAHTLDRQLAGPVIPLAPCVHGYIGVAEVYLALGAHRRIDAAIRRAAQTAARRLTRFARAFPMAEPAALRVSAKCAQVDDLTALAVRRLRASVTSARDLAMPYDEAMAHAELAAIEPDPDSAARHREQARELYSRLTARRELEQLAAIS